MRTPISSLPLKLAGLLALALLLPSQAFAACTSPAGTIGSLNWASTKFQYCDGSAWQDIGGNATPGGSTTQVQYNNAGALAADSGFTYAGSGAVTISTSTAVTPLSVTSSVAGGAYGINVQLSGATGTNHAGWFENASTGGRGVRGLASATTGSTIGVIGQSASSTGYGVYGTASSISGANFGGYFTSSSSGGTALQAIAGNAGTKVLVVQAAGSQTADLAEFQDSSGTALTVVDKSGNVGIGSTTPAGPLDIASTRSTTALSTLNINTTLTGAVTPGRGAASLGYGQSINLTANPSANSTGVYGLNVAVQNAGSNPIISLTGINAAVTAGNASVGGINGLIATAINNTYAMTSATGASIIAAGQYTTTSTGISTSASADVTAQAIIINSSSVTPTGSGNAYGISMSGVIGGNTGSGYGLYMQSVSAGTAYGIKMDQVGNGSTATAAYGVYVSGVAVSSGTTLYDIYAADASAKNYFAGNVGIGTTAPGARLVVSGNTAALSTSLSPIAQFASADGSSTTVETSAYGATPKIAFRRGNTSAASPSAIQSADTLGVINWAGYGATAYSGARAQIGGNASEAWTDSAQGTYISFTTTATGGITTTEKMRLDPSGNLGVGTTTVNHKLDVNGNIGVVASGYINFGTTDGTGGYGFKDNGGTLQYKNSGGSWTNLSGGASTFAAGLVGTPGWAVTGDTDTGLWEPAANTLSTSAGGVEVLRLNTVASGVNYITMTPSTTTNTPFISTGGADTDVSIAIMPKGAGVVRVFGNGTQQLSSQTNASDATAVWGYAGGSGISYGGYFTTDSVTAGSASLKAKTGNAAGVGFIVQAGSSVPTGNLTEWQNSSGTVLAKVDSAGNISTPSVILTSDSRYKKDIEPLKSGALEIVSQLQPVTYEWKSGDTDKHIGFIAQDVEKVLPAVVSTDEQSADKKKGIRYNEIIPVLVKAIQEQQEEIKSLKLEVKALKDKSAAAK